MCVGKSFSETMACDPGWAVNMMFMHWRMYRGHNCTNYVAWRLSKDGVPEPNFLLGNAGSWASRAKKHGIPVDSTPEAGAAGTWPGRNHVVYVEQVGPNYLLITEDSFTSKRYRRYLAYQGERNYPKQFIHFRGKNAIIGGLPTVSGTPLVGQVLTATPGTWGPAGVRLAYQWLRDGVVVSGATRSTYRLTKADAGHRMSISITGTLAGKLPRTASSIQTEPVMAGVITPGSVQVSGLPVQNQTLTAVTSGWRPSDIQLTYQWFASGSPISGATRPTLQLTKKQRGKTITVRVTGSGPGYKAVPVTSAPTPKVVKEGQVVGPVTAGTPTITGPASLMVGDRLTAQPGAWLPAPVTTTVQWLRDGVAIPGATTWAYTLTTADVGKSLRVDVTGSRPSFTAARASSASTQPINPRRLRTLTAPTLAGSGLVGTPLTAQAGTWAPKGVVTTLTWTRDGKAIPGAKGVSYAVTPADRAHTIGVVVTAKLKGFPTESRTLALGHVAQSVPQFKVGWARTDRKHTVRLVLSATSLGQPVSGTATITEGAKAVGVVKIWRAVTSEYVYKAKPGVHALTLTYGGPAWLTPATKVVSIPVK